MYSPYNYIQTSYKRGNDATKQTKGTKGASTHPQEKQNMWRMGRMQEMRSKHTSMDQNIKAWEKGKRSINMQMGTNPNPLLNLGVWI